MQLIIQNPYRTVGVLANTGTKDFSRISKERGRFLSAGQQPDAEYSFPCLGNYLLTEEGFTKAKSKLDGNKNKLEAALFWFIQQSDADEEAIEALQAGNIEPAAKWWGSLRQNNQSEAFNLSTLLLYKALSEPVANNTLLAEATTLKLSFLESAHFSALLQAVTDETYSITPEDAQILFLQLLWKALTENHKALLMGWISGVMKIKFKANKQFIQWLTNTHIQAVETKIEDANIKRRTNKAAGVNLGEQLLAATENDLQTLELLQTKKSSYYIGVSDKVAEEILWCAKDYFAYYEEDLSATKFAEEAGNLAKKAQPLALGKAAQEHNKTFADKINYHIENLPLLRKKKLVKADYEAISNKLEAFESLSSVGREHVREFVNSCIPHLTNMETILGTWDDFYLEISTIVARTAQNMLVKIDELISNQVVNIVNILNNLNKNSSYYYIPDDAKNTLQDLQKSLKQIYDTYTIILKFKLQKSLRETATRNRKISREFINNLNSFTSGLTIYADSFDDVSAHLAPQDRKSSKPPKSKPHSEVGNSDNQTAKSKESNSGYSLTAALAGLGVIGLLIWWFTGSSANNSDAVEVGSTAVEISHDLVLVPGGSFMMGCTAEQKQYCESAEKPAHKVTLDSFYISKYEVTQLQWEKVMGSNPSSNVGCNSCPVENVSWEDVQAFIDRLNAALPDSLKKTGVYRLPTEAEWEYAARGGATATSPKEARGKNKSLNNSFVYAGGNNIEDVAWYSSNSNSTHPVGQKQPNKLGLYDMSGNVWEWCGDGYGDYQSNPQANPRGAASGSYRVLRGGSWTNGAVNCRVAYRHDNTPTYRYINYGFRVVLVP